MASPDIITIQVRGGEAVLHGRTYPLRERLKALGASWDAQLKSWVLPARSLPELQEAARASGVSLIQESCQASADHLPNPTTPPNWEDTLIKITALLERIAIALETLAIEALKKGGNDG